MTNNKAIHSIAKKKSRSPGRRKDPHIGDIWAQLGVSVTDQRKKQITKDILQSLHNQNLLRSDYRRTSTIRAVNQAVVSHIENFAQEFQPKLEQNREETLALFRKLIVRRKWTFRPPEGEIADNQEAPEIPTAADARATTPVPVIQEALAGTRAPPNTPTSVTDYRIAIVEPFNIVLEEEKTPDPPMPPVKEGHLTSGEQEDLDLDDLGVDDMPELSAEELRTVKGSPRRPRSPGFRKDKVLAVRQIPTTRRLYQDGYLSPVSDPVFRPSMALNRVFSLFQYDINKVQTDCKAVLVNSTRGMAIAGAALELISGVKYQQEFPILSRLAIGQARITKAYRRPYETIIYTICPHYNASKFRSAWDRLWLCYHDIFELAERNKVDSISVPPLAVDFGFPAKAAAELTLGVVREYLETKHSYEATLRRVVICGINENELEPYQSSTPKYFPPAN